MKYSLAAIPVILILLALSGSHGKVAAPSLSISNGPDDKVILAPGAWSRYEFDLRAYHHYIVFVRGSNRGGNVNCLLQNGEGVTIDQDSEGRDGCTLHAYSPKDTRCFLRIVNDGAKDSLYTVEIKEQ